MTFAALQQLGPGDWARILTLPLVGLFTCLIIWLIRLMLPPEPVKAANAIRTAYEFGQVVERGRQQRNAIDSSNYTPGGAHIHQIDFERSTMFASANGSILAKCCVQGCSALTEISPKVVQLDVEVTD